MDWKQRLGVEKTLKRAIKSIKARGIQHDGEAIHLLRVARSAVKYGRTFTEQSAIESSRPRRGR